MAFCCWWCCHSNGRQLLLYLLCCNAMENVCRCLWFVPWCRASWWLLSGRKSDPSPYHYHDHKVNHDQEFNARNDVDYDQTTHNTDAEPTNGVRRTPGATRRLQERRTQRAGTPDVWSCRPTFGRISRTKNTMKKTMCWHTRRLKLQTNLW